MKEIRGKIVSTPVVLQEKYTAIVLIMVETRDGCKEFYKDRTFTYVRELIDSEFSKIALSAVGDDVKFDVSDDNRIWHFKNITHNF